MRIIAIGISMMMCYAPGLILACISCWCAEHGHKGLCVTFCVLSCLFIVSLKLNFNTDQNEKLEKKEKAEKVEDC